MIRGDWTSGFEVTAMLSENVLQRYTCDLEWNLKKVLERSIQVERRQEVLQVENVLLKNYCEVLKQQLNTNDKKVEVNNTKVEKKAKKKEKKRRKGYMFAGARR